jgi:hypothetical protein
MSHFIKKKKGLSTITTHATHPTVITITSTLAKIKRKRPKPNSNNIQDSNNIQGVGRGYEALPTLAVMPWNIQVYRSHTKEPH